MLPCMHMLRRPAILVSSAVAAAIFLLLPASSSAVNTKLLADISIKDTGGPGCEQVSVGYSCISLKDANGTSVTHLDPGTYEIDVTDQVDKGSFHLTGPGVDKATGISEIVTTTWTVTFIDGHYHFRCDARPTTMFGDFTVGNPSTTSAPTVALGKPIVKAPGLHAGRRFTISTHVATNASTVRVTCAAKIGGRPVRNAGRYANNSAICSGSLPKGTAGKRLIGSVTASIVGQTVTKSFSRVIRP
jgi:hypothetical protein